MDVVKHHNDINKIKLGTLTEKELDIFITLIFTMQEQGTREISMSFTELKGMVETQREVDKRLVNRIRGLNKKLIQLNQEIKTDRGWLTFNLFEKLEIFEDTRVLNIKITEIFSHMLNSLTKDFTYYGLKEYINLKSKYSKQIYKILKQYRGNNWFQIDLIQFKEILNIPIYKTSKENNDYLNKTILTPIQKELTPIFLNLKILKLTKDGKPVSRGKKTYSLKFTWDKKFTQNKSLLQNIQKKQDKAIIEANEKAKRKIERQQQERQLKINEKNKFKELSPIENLKGDIAKELIKKKKINLFNDLSLLNTIKDLENFIKENNINLKKKRSI